MDHLTPLSSSPSPPPRPPSRHPRISLRRRRVLPAGRTTLPPLMWQQWNIRAWRAAGRGGEDVWGAGRWEPTGNKSGCPWGMCHSDLPLPEAGGSLRSHLPFLWLGAKKVVLEKLKRLCHMIQWAIVGKGAQGVEHTITWGKLQPGRVCVEMCVYCICERKGGREVIYESGNKLAGKNHRTSVCGEWATGRRENARLWARCCLPWHLPEVLLRWPFHLVF